MNARYFKSFAAIWKFTDNEGNFCRLNDPDDILWMRSVCGIEDMEGDRYTEITAEEGEP